MKQLLLLLALLSPSFAQLPVVDYAGMFFQVSPAQPIRKVASLPATCTAVGSASSSNAVLYQGRVYQCTSTNTWTFAVGQSAALTAGRLPYAGTGGILADSANATLDSAGKLSLGAPSSTSEKLNVNGNAYFQGTFPYFQLFSTTSGGGWNQSAYLQVGVNITAAAAGDYATFLVPSNRGFSFVGTSTPRLVMFPTSGRVGINTSSDLAQLGIVISTAATPGAIIRGAASQSANILETQNSSGTALTYVDASGRLYPLSVAFASLGTPGDSAIVFCTDCTKATPCASGGNGALAKRINGAWDCD